MCQSELWYKVVESFQQNALEEFSLTKSLGVHSALHRKGTLMKRFHLLEEDLSSALQLN